MNTVIRKLELTDIEKLNDMGSAVRYIDCLKKYKSLRAQTFIYEKDGEIIGFMQTEKTIAGGILLNYLYIKKEFRGQGEAKRFFNYVRETYLKRLAIICYHHKELTNFYKKMEFIDSSVLRISMYPATQLERQILEQQRDEIQKNEAKI